MTLGWGPEVRLYGTMSSVGACILTRTSVHWYVLWVDCECIGLEVGDLN
jgi:hypothetical protein